MRDQKARFARHYTVDPETGCWLWHGHTDEDGYGRARWGSRKRYVHRIVYELYEGLIPEELQIDHLCRVRNCCNPAHLEPVTARTNQVRGETFTAENVAKMKCPKGHEYDRVVYNADGSFRQRGCSICEREKFRRWYYKNKERQECATSAR